MFEVTADVVIRNLEVRWLPGCRRLTQDTGGAGEIRSGRRRNTRVFGSPLIRWRRSGVLAEMWGWRGEVCGDKPLNLGRSTHYFPSQDPLVSDLVARGQSFSMRRRAGRGKRNRVFLDGYRIAIHPLIWFSALSRLNKRDNF